MSEVTARATQQAVEDLTSYLINSGAENYIEDHYTIRIDGGSETTAVITVQFTDKPSAHELRVKAETECERLRAALKSIYENSEDVGAKDCALEALSAKS
jgi:hypothetical protein